MEKEIKKTSDLWEKDCPYIILDPDGWDRTNFKFSFYQEEITHSEFTTRLVLSTTKKK